MPKTGRKVAKSKPKPKMKADRESQTAFNKGNIDKTKGELKKLIVDGTDILRRMFKDEQANGSALATDYQIWYTAALSVIKQIAIDRLDDFISYYEVLKAKDLSISTYGIKHYLSGISLIHSDSKNIAISKFNQQISILKSTEQVFESSLFDIREMIQADLFDTELEKCKELCKKGFVRAAGAVAGVVLERHLKTICSNHNLKITKKKPNIGDLNELLKKEKIYDQVEWRKISFLADIRNLCDHDRDAEPTKQNVLELIDGVERVIKLLH